MKAVIMAGGKGTRLRPLTDEIPKPLVPIIDKPVMAHIIELLKRHGIEEIACTLGYRADQIIDRFGDGSDYGVRLTYFVEKEPLGTAGSVKNAKSFLDEDFVVISGDAYTDLDLTRAIRYHYAKHSPFTIVSTPCKNPAGFGVAETDHDGKLIAFVEKPDDPRPALINCGIYIADRSILDRIPDGFYDFGRQLIPNLCGEAYCYVTFDYWSDIGTLPSYYYTNYLVAATPAYAAT